MKILKTLGLMLSVVFVTGCGSTADVTTTKPTDKDLSSYNTFAYLPNSELEETGGVYNNDRIGTAIVETINQNMREAGYRLDRDNPDLLVLADAGTDLERRRTTEPVYAAYPYGGAMAGAPVRPFYEPYFYRGYANFPGIIGFTENTTLVEEGVLVIYLVDRETREVVWKGVASKEIYDDSQEEIRDLVNEIFEEYPLSQNN